ncbi:magnesium and cobalt transport protein CorA [Nonomuraea sp. KC401]|uniref:Magnesium and cobalt transport protein CorA n=1 Tax=Nonomuraea longispora TaxID=1848320 RepID=A0A4R4MRU1_9ACTN|nr:MULTISPECIES: magnesium and cobalt transport protein CorA [Nonomuraea]NBE99158.1 transporter [Nonomuraea sp. K271]TDB98820.1 magnesium and cobalt transport protein CorA [Nonomuraea longispora]TLF57714.1 magnesium and cobalt transport protein CorA [Nonomuraea sp. KC401]
MARLRGLRRGPDTRGEAPELSMDPRASEEPPYRPTVIDNAIYRDGQRVDNPGSLADAFERLKQEPGSMAWIGLYRPKGWELVKLGEEFELHELALEDAIVGSQRPKADRYGDTLFVVLRAARYLDDVEEVAFGELHVFVGPNFVITVRHAEAPDLHGVRRRMESDPDLLRQGPQAVLYAILDAVVDGYAPVVAGLQKDIEEIEVQVFGGDPSVSRRVYELSGEVIEFQRATAPLIGMIHGFIAGAAKYGVTGELESYLRDVADHAITVAERISSFRQMLQNILIVNSTLVTQAQNEEMARMTEASIRQGEEVKKISAWAAILFAPTLVGTIYGMNFDVMPETHWAYGYPFAMLLMAAVCLVLYTVFKRRDWL